MRALVKESAGPGAAIREVPVPSPAPASSWSRSRPPACAAPTSTSSAGTNGRRSNFGPPPMTFGHEMAGLVVARGEGATRIPLGDAGRRGDAPGRLDVLPVPHRPRPRLPEHADPGRDRCRAPLPSTSSCRR